MYTIIVFEIKFIFQTTFKNRYLFLF